MLADQLDSPVRLVREVVMDGVDVDPRRIVVELDSVA
jgi:hypothetical protein